MVRKHSGGGTKVPPYPLPYLVPLFGSLIWFPYLVPLFGFIKGRGSGNRRFPDNVAYTIGSYFF